MKSNLSQKFQFAFLAQNQAQKEVLVNEKLNNGIISRSKDTPPAQPYGDLYLVPKASKDAWHDFAEHLAFFTDTVEFHPSKIWDDFHSIR